MKEENCHFIVYERNVAQNLFLQCGPKFIRGGPGVKLDINFRNKEKDM